jgi:replicative DNA helicase
MTNQPQFEIERELIGPILVNNEAFDHVSPFLRSEHFGEPVHRRVFEAAVALIGAGATVTPITLKAAFARDLMVEPDMPIWRYLAHCAGNAVWPIENATGRAIRVIVWTRERGGDAPP